jgi:hypothetical protein
MVLFGPPKPPAPAPAAELPEPMKKIADQIETFMPMIENLTGLKRHEIFLHLLKTGVRGGSIDSFINGLMGRAPAPEAKFVRYVKTLALWGPLAFFLMGLAIMGLYFFTKLMVNVIGAMP